MKWNTIIGIKYHKIQLHDIQMEERQMDRYIESLWDW